MSERHEPINPPHPSIDALHRWLMSRKEARDPEVTEHVEGCERCTSVVAAGAAAINRS